MITWSRLSFLRNFYLLNSMSWRERKGDCIFNDYRYWETRLQIWCDIVMKKQVLGIQKNITWVGKNTYAQDKCRPSHQRGWFQLELLILQYNLDGKVYKQYQYMYQEGANNLCWYWPTDYTDDLVTPETGAGNHIKFWFGVYTYDWIWDSNNLELC